MTNEEKDQYATIIKRLVQSDDPKTLFADILYEERVQIGFINSKPYYAQLEPQVLEHLKTIKV